MIEDFKYPGNELPLNSLGANDMFYPTVFSGQYKGPDTFVKGDDGYPVNGFVDLAQQELAYKKAARHIRSLTENR